MLAGSHSVDPSIKICPPKSLAEWKIQHGMDYQIENQETSKCKVKIPEPKRWHKNVINYIINLYV